MNKKESKTKQTILISDYNLKWPIIYNREKTKIFKVIGDNIIAIEHIGSTAIINLAAKPVIDIMIAIKTLNEAKKLITPLRNIGYKYVPEYEAQLPERRFFHRGPSETTGQANRHFHLHIVEYTSQFWEDHLLFRDYLRNHHKAALKYERLKKNLSIQCQGNIQIYCEGKTDFIKNILELAHEESGSLK